MIALVRNPDKAEAKEIQALGAELCVGDSNDFGRDSPQLDVVGTCDWVVWLSVNWADFAAELPINKCVLAKLEATSRQFQRAQH